MKISIITVCFNSAKFICTSIESVFNQTYPDIEYIIVDGYSNDNTLDIIKEYEQKFNNRMYWISEPDQGIYDAMNKGIQIASGEIVGILNSDDFFIDNYIIEDIIEIFKTYEVEAIYGNLLFVSKNDTSIIRRRWIGSPYRENNFRKGWHPAHPTFYVKRSCYLKYGLYDISLNISADFELMLRFIEKYNITTYYYDRYFVKMRLGGKSTSSIFNILKGNRNIMKAFKKNNIPISILYPVQRLFPKIIDLLKRLL